MTRASRAAAIWTAIGEAFQDQPIEGDTVHARRSDSVSGHKGRYWVGTRAPKLSSMEVFKAEAVAPLVVWLCSDAAANVNGRDFYVAGNEVGLFPELEVERLLYR